MSPKQPTPPPVLPTPYTTAPKDGMSVTIHPNDKGSPAGKLCDAEVTFTAPGPFQGLRLLGFAVWERRSGSGHNVTFPARTYSVNGERRSFSLLRPQTGDDGSMRASDRARDLILQAWAEYETLAGTNDDRTTAPPMQAPQPAPADADTL